MARPSVIVDKRFSVVNDQFKRAVEEALGHGAGAVLASVRALETRVGDASDTRKVYPGRHLKDSFSVRPVAREHGGSRFEVAVVTDDPNAVWQNDGTRRRRRKKVSQRNQGKLRRSGAELSGGVKPLRFMQKGLKLAMPAVIASFERSFRGL